VAEEVESVCEIPFITNFAHAKHELEETCEEGATMNVEKQSELIAGEPARGCQLSFCLCKSIDGCNPAGMHVTGGRIG